MYRLMEAQTAWAAECLASRSMPFDTHPLLPLFFLARVAFVAGLCLMTLARLTFRLGLGRVWTPSFIFRTPSLFDSCPYSDTISLSAVIWIFVLYPFVSWLVGVVVVIYMFFWDLL